MNNNYIPILVQRENKKEVWQLDINGLNITELCEIKKAITEKEPYSKSILALDKVIKASVEEITPNMHKESYVRTYKHNKKEQIQRMKRKKVRRKYK